MVRGTFSPARAWRLAVGPASTRTLGLAATTVQYASRVSACRRELNSHNGEAAKASTRDIDANVETRRKRATSSASSSELLAPGRNLLLRRRGAIASHRPGQLRGGIGFQSVRGAAAPSIEASTRPVRCGGSKTILQSIRCGQAGARVSGYPSTGARTVQRGLTLRPRRGPTASHQARATGTVYIFRGPGLAACRWARLNSNVRPQQPQPRASRHFHVPLPDRRSAAAGALYLVHRAHTQETRTTPHSVPASLCRCLYPRRREAHFSHVPRLRAPNLQGYPSLTRRTCQV